MQNAGAEPQSVPELQGEPTRPTLAPAPGAPPCGGSRPSSGGMPASTRPGTSDPGTSGAGAAPEPCCPGRFSPRGAPLAAAPCSAPESGLSASPASERARRTGSFLQPSSPRSSGASSAGGTETSRRDEAAECDARAMPGMFGGPSTAKFAALVARCLRARNRQRSALATPALPAPWTTLRCRWLLTVPRARRSARASALRSAALARCLHRGRCPALRLGVAPPARAPPPG